MGDELNLLKGFSYNKVTMIFWKKKKFIKPRFMKWNGLGDAFTIDEEGIV